MKRSVHAFIGFAAGLLVGGASPYTLLCGIAGFLGGWFPDYDLRFRHRKLLHNVFMLVLSSYIVFYLVQEAFRRLRIGFPGEAPLYIALAFFSGWALHILLDATTKRGTYLLWPLYGKPLRIPIFRSSSFAANFVGIGLGMLLLAIWLSQNNPLEKLAVING